ncbi:nuclear transport factor 2 family protein [Maribacter litopenaei]|uniref:Nuclear transport factor 2 family protein n=1 Tax=Maribacter litopenaei TaxID=2976127 RepID=A0ABY5Y3Z2_9FLAO|nr:nuclear transport factor 2 family protein [Maribacter litopenaei]UWX53708.1 nuclear transport factor 2 family protein [Maribacter litopenaei]
MEWTDGAIKIGEPKNISNNEGYDNQPSFYDDDRILFAFTRNGQTDIALYHINSESKSWISNTPNGGEYSPLRITGQEDISAIRLDNDGLQRLYKYDFKTGQDQELISDLKVGYHVWYNDHIIVCTVLVENRMDLVVVNLQNNTRYTMQKNVGRSLHRIPQTELISYISKENDTTMIKSMHPISGTTTNIVGLIDPSEDICWIQSGTIITGYENSLLSFDYNKGTSWKQLHTFDKNEITKISRLSINPNGKRLAFVSEDPKYKIVQKQVESYNSGDLEAFVNCYDENVVVQNFPADTLYLGHQKMRENYGSLSPDNKKYDVEVVNRITVGNFVIDHEKVTGGESISNQVAIYEVADRISSMTFIFENGTEPDPEPIVQEQLEAYNKRNIEAFMATYSDDVKLYNFPKILATEVLRKCEKAMTDFLNRLQTCIVK